MRLAVISVLCLIVSICEVKTARILCVFPIPSKSHHIVFRNYVQELAKRGHELVVITPNHVPGDYDNYNVTNIDIGFAYKEKLERLFDPNKGHDRGVIVNVESVLKHNLYAQLLDVIVEEFNSPQVQKLLNDKSQKFDLIVAEAFYEYQLIVSEIFKAPVVFFPSFMGFPEHYEMMGAIGRHPILYPHFHRMDYTNLGFWEILREVYYEIRLYNLFRNVEMAQDKRLKENFGPQAPTTEELRKRVDLYMLNSNAIFANNRPVPPNIVFLGATHLLPAQEIPMELKGYLDNSSRGVVYVSFGSNVRPSMMEKSLLDALLQAFKALPYDILWRFDGESLDNVPENVKWQQWFPQRDLLFHPNIKAFVTQCGLQSADEAIDAEVPLIGVPMMAEQWYNAQKFDDFGIGVKLDSLTLTADDLVKGVKTVIGDKRYKENIKRLRSIYNDSPQKPLEKAIWWTEYVIRHGGAKHLRSPIADMTWTEYYMLRIFLPVIGAALISLVIVVFLVRCLLKILVNSICGKKKIKRS